MQNHPKLILKSFLEAWKTKDHAKMFKLTQKTWQGNHSKKDLKQLLPKRLKSYRIIEITEATQTVFDAKISIVLGSHRKQVTVRLICEKEAYRPSVDGVFGVNPISLIKGLY